MATGDITASILKIVSAIASTKAAFKFIFIALLLVLLYIFVYAPLISLGIPSEAINSVIPLVSVGVSVLFVELGSYYISKYEKSNELTEKNKLAEEAKALNTQKEQDLQQVRVDAFKHAFPYLSSTSKSLLWKGFNQDYLLQPYGDDFNNYKELLDHDAIVLKAFVNQRKSLYMLSPVLKAYIEKEYENKIVKDVYDFKSNLSPKAEELLNIFVNPNKESKYNFDSFHLLKNSPLFYGNFSKTPLSVKIEIKESYREHVLGFFEDTFGDVAEAVYEANLTASQLYIEE
ncbi:hypothetical protein [Colwellia sp. MB02u-9]|uniref:hypothetical protein n=1 Tax=Colwellia sp. MB02u-9 TaxID=2759823 RepID=UPI0015F55833|nr:hypothetical protein [Colwellia sp. MB02u-9]MBA6296190.1 hypothetical protein [Colwellia sp. MB02u-9]